MEVKKEEKNYTIMPGLNGGAYSSSRRLAQSIKYEPSKTIESSSNQQLEEAVDMLIDEDKGGIIILSTDVNAIAQSENKLINWVKKKMSTLQNRLKATSKIDKIAQDHNLLGWTIGKYLDGRYTSKDGTPFGENSLSIMVVGVPTNEMIDIATDLCNEFKQETVLYKDFDNGNIYFINGDKATNEN